MHIYVLLVIISAFVRSTHPRHYISCVYSYACKYLPLYALKEVTWIIWGSPAKMGSVTPHVTMATKLRTIRKCLSICHY